MKFTAFFVLASFAGAFLGWPAVAFAQQTPTVSIDGSPMSFSDQPPVERAGRIYVPMRAIFQRLGAMVVYQNGTINATRGRRTISLQIGSPTAMIDGQNVTLDSPPFEIAGRTLVPLRFVSQALGAHVGWNESQMTAYIQTTGMGAGSAYNPSRGYNPGYNPGYGHRALLSMRSPTGNVSQRYPRISASFREPLRTDSVVVRLDGRNVTDNARVWSTGFALNPRLRLSPGSHSVTVAGMADNGSRVYGQWDFTVTAY
ncbi:MAG: copper amine oxidase N-terminal domain-containing protein [Candidatus Tyrphobacter sp.]